MITRFGWYGMCPECGQFFQVRKDGFIRRHIWRWYSGRTKDGLCSGSGQPPKVFP